MSTPSRSRPARGIFKLTHYLMDGLLEQLTSHIVKSVRKWSLANYLLDLSISVLTAFFSGWSYDMPFWQILIVAFLTAIAVGSWMVLFDAFPLNRVRLASEQIREVAEKINLSGLNVQPSVSIGDELDPLEEAMYVLEANVKPQIVKRYRKILKGKNAKAAAKTYLESLAGSLSKDQLS